MTSIGIIGAGNIGSQVARAAARAGFDVVVSNSQGPATLAGLVADLGPRGQAGTVDDAAAADVVVVAVPLGSFADVPVEPLAGKIVIVTSNYNPGRDGHVATLDDGTGTVAGRLQAHLPASRVVKAFSHLSAADLTKDGSPAGTPDRRALAVAGDDAEAKKFVTDLYDRAGFDTVDIGGLADSWKIGMGQPAFVTRQNAEQLRENVARARR
ncbi:MAG: NAD(P)-binding domain-containing protein [Actinobacteria bacterium]|nr:NAD(P)-binding domain-containing protein [Actinomycetota bacterium]